MLIAALSYIDNTDLYEFNEWDDSAEEVVAKVQLLLDTWYEVLKITNRMLKLLKYYWMLQNYEWKDSKCILVSDTTLYLIIKIGEIKSELEHLKVTQIRVLVGVLTNLSYQLTQIEDSYSQRISSCISKLGISTLNL